MGFPAIFAVCAVILVLFAVGLVAVAKRIPKPGGFFTFVGCGLGKPAGLSAAYLALLTYTTILIVGALGYRRIDLSFKVLGVLLVCEVGIALALVLAVVATSGQEGLSATPFLPSAVFSGSPGIGLMFAFAAFLGFESTVIFRDEAKTPDRTIPKATYTAVIGVGVFYTITAFVLIAIFAALTSIAVIVYFRTADTDRQLWNTLIAPALGFVGLIGSAVVIGINFPFLVGDVNAKGAPVFGAVSAILLGLILVFPVAGLIQAAVLKRRNAPAYESITDAIAG